MAIDKLTLLSIHETPGFQDLLKELRKFEPKVPQYDPKEDNIEDMKFESARHQMFSTFMAVIDPFSSSNYKQ